MTRDRIFEVEEIRRFAAEASAREDARAEAVATRAGRELIRKSRIVIEQKGGSVITVTDGDVLDDIRAIEAETVEPLRQALEQALDRIETAFNAMHPGDYTDDELHGLAQGLWFGAEEVRAAPEP